MTRHWTFGRRVGAGFALTLILAIAVGAVSAIALRSVRSSKDQITGYAARLTQTEQLRALRAQRSAELRSYTQTTEASHLAALRAARSDYVATVGRIRTGLRSGEERRLLDAVSKADDAYQRQLDKVTAAPETVTANADQTRTVTLQVDSAVAAFVAQETKLLNAASRSASNTTAWALGLVSSLTAVAVLLGILVAYLVTRTLNRQIGSTVGQVQSSAAELETAASQQATSAKEEATAMAQITTTMSELLSTSREIAGDRHGGTRVGDRYPAAGRAHRRPHAGAGRQVAADRRRPRHRRRTGRADQHPGDQRDHRGGRRR
jgi:CHASE3 domain sensor protein